MNAPSRSACSTVDRRRITWRTAAWAGGWLAFGALDGALNRRHDGSTLSETYRRLELPDWFTAGALFAGATVLADHLSRRRV